MTSMTPPATMNILDAAFGKFELELLETTAAAANVDRLEFLQALGAANTLMAMTEDSSTEASSFGDGYDSDNTNEQAMSEVEINLYDPSDEGRIGGYHNVFRRDIYEGYIVPAGEKYSGTVAFRCKFCKHLPYKARAKQSEVYPRTIQGLYRAHIRFNHDHFPSCSFIPDEIKAKVAKLRKTSPRGNKAYWVTSALKKGLINNQNGIIICGMAKV